MIDSSHQLVESNAHQRAILMVHRLAPEARIADDGLIVGDWHFRYDSVIGARIGESYCCSFTFVLVHSNPRTGTTVLYLCPPRLEQALTIYLYWKLFHSRFDARPMKIFQELSYDR